MEYALIRDGCVCNVVVADENFIESIRHEWDHIEALDTALEQGMGVGRGWGWDGGFVPPQQPSPQPVEPEWEWFIDIGPFFDRFGAAKMAVLTSTDAGVRAILSDLQVRKWIDLQREDVFLGLQYVGSEVPAVTAEMQEAILTTPVALAENLALRKQFFS
ncbi:hypothetical protein D3C71_1182630 [compost metagenome]